jgi:transposase
LLDLNENINIAYMLKDDLKRLWDYKSPGYANQYLDSWINTARASNIGPLVKFAQTLDSYRPVPGQVQGYGLINHCYYPINTGKLEGMNNKIKVIKRTAYGFHDDDYFILKINQGCSPRYKLAFGKVPCLRFRPPVSALSGPEDGCFLHSNFTKTRALLLTRTRVNVDIDVCG